MEGLTTPRTTQEMIDQGWYEKILAKVKKYTLNDVVNSADDLVQEIFLQIESTKYLERFDAKQRNFEVYIYVFVMNAVKKRGIREGSKNGRMIVNHFSLESSQDENDPTPAGKVFLDRLEECVGNDDPFAEVFVQELIEETRKSLAKYKASSTVEYNGEIIQRDPLTVFNYILEEKTVPEIAEIFNTSKQFIYDLLNKIRTTPEMTAFYEEMRAMNRISPKGRRRKRTIENAFFVFWNILEAILYCSLFLLSKGGNYHRHVFNRRDDHQGSLVFKRSRVTLS